MLSRVAKGLQDFLSKLARAGAIDEAFIKSSIKELQKILISGDVNVRLVIELSKKIEDRMRKENIPKGVSHKQYFLKVVYDELANLLGAEGAVEIKPQKILLVGLYGHGKTTTAAKLAKFFSKRGLKTALITTDNWRPAAYEQLSQLGKRINIPVFGDPNSKPIEVLREGMKKFDKYDVLIVDSAGRDSLNQELIDEIKELKEELKPDNVWLVMGGDIGQAAEREARSFNEAVGITGIILTRMDSSAKGGGALAACKSANVPVVFIGTGEKLDDIEVFDKDRFISRLLGFPDIASVLEKFKESVEEEEIEDITKGEFTLTKFYKQLEATKKMGSLSKVLEMLGLAQKLPQEVVEQGEQKMKVFKVIMDSMTKEELENPDILNKSRIERIARGSGRTEKEVRELLKQYKMAKKMINKMKSGKKRFPIPGLPKDFNMGLGR